MPHEARSTVFTREMRRTVVGTRNEYRDEVCVCGKKNTSSRERLRLPQARNLLILESYQNFVVKDIGDKGLKNATDMRHEFLPLRTSRECSESRT